MIKLHFSIHFLLLFQVVNVNAQQTNNQSPHIFSIAYFGEALSHPGINFTYDRSLKTWQWKKVKKNGKEKIRNFNLSWSNNFAFYHHRRNHNGNILATGVTLSMTKKKGWYYQLGLFSGGNLRYFNEAVFKVNENNQVEKIKNANNLTFINGFKTSIGKKIKFKKSVTPYSIYFGSTIFWATPFGTSSINQSATELGIKYHL